MKKGLSMILCVALLLCCIPGAYAAEEDGTFFFALSVDGSDTKQVMPGDMITVVFNLYRTDSDEPYPMYAMQNEIRYDSEFFRLVEGSELLSDGIRTTDLGLRDQYREFYMSFVSMSGGEEWKAQRLVGSIQLEVIGQSGVSKITNQDYLVSAADGQGHYEASCQDVTIIVSTDCTVTFESNGGSPVPSQSVRYGEKVLRPEDPIREGYHLEGWYTDLDLQNPWDFDKDTVQGNLTLYAKWAQGDPAGEIHWLWWIVPVVLLLLILLLLLRRKTVRFETGCKAAIRPQKIRKGSYAQRPEDPSQEGRSFAGWYCDEEKTVLWDFENNKVKKSMTLYAKWL